MFKYKIKKKNYFITVYYKLLIEIFNEGNVHIR